MVTRPISPEPRSGIEQRPLQPAGLRNRTHRQRYGFTGGDDHFQGLGIDADLHSVPGIDRLTVDMEGAGLVSRDAQ